MAFIYPAYADTTVPGHNMQPQLDLVATAHLDTEWRWTVRETICRYLPDTVRQNTERFAKYPDYVFNFEGGIRYMFLKQYYPALFDEVKKNVDAGRWNISGPGLVAFDVNLPASESLIRSILYAQAFYREQFKTNAPDVFLPDCFGFTYALPTIAAHCGMKGFVTQKLGWDCAVGIPFRVGFWQGVDGSVLPSVLHAELYTSIIRQDLTRNPDWLAFAEETGRLCGIPRAYHLFGVGDRGGAPDMASIAWAEGFYSSDGPLKVRMARSKDIFYALNSSNVIQRPLYDGELLLTRHGTGGYTSKALIKKWNRQCEQLAAAAERAAVAAYVLCGKRYPHDRLQKAWQRILLHHFHDSITGVSTPEVNHMILNDFTIARMVFEGILEDSVAAWSRCLNTLVPGVPILVYNPSGERRAGLVDIEIPVSDESIGCYRMYTPEGKEVPLQMGRRSGGKQTLTFPAEVPSVGLSVYSLQTSDVPFCVSKRLLVTEKGIENQRYKLVLNEQGNIASIYDRMQDTELLSAPVELQMLDDYPWDWPEWEITYDNVCGPQKGHLCNPVVTVEEQGPLRATLRVEREVGTSVFVDHISLCSVGPVDRIHVRSVIDWHSTGTLVKVAFPFSFASENAVYDLGVGVIERGTNTPALYEVPAQQWAGLCDEENRCGVAILNDSKYGWDHPQANMLRMTVLHSPNDVTIDMGRHEFEYEIMGFAGGWTNGVLQAAEALNQPLYAFTTDRHNGRLGHSSSLIALNDKGVKLMALKQAEEGENIVLRLAEGYGVERTNVKIQVHSLLEDAWQINGIEADIKSLKTDDNAISLSFEPYSIKTVSLDILSARACVCSAGESVAMECDEDITRAATVCGESGDARWFAEALWETNLTVKGIKHVLQAAGHDVPDAVSCCGQAIMFPKGEYDAVSFLAASLDGDKTVEFQAGEQVFTKMIPDFAEPLMEGSSAMHNPHRQDAVNMRQPIAFKDCRLAETFDYCINQDGKIIPYKPAHLFHVLLPVTGAIDRLILPVEPQVKVAAVSLVGKRDDQTTALSGPDLETRIDADIYPGCRFIRQAVVTLTPRPSDAVIYYTLDGSLPTRDAMLYTNKLTIKSNAFLRARAFCEGYYDQCEVRFKFDKHRMLPGKHLRGMKPGLKYNQYEGRWSSLPDTSTLTPVKTGIAEHICIPDGVSGDGFAIDYSGYLLVPEDGVYTFWLTSDDGSRLYIDGIRVVNNDGLHSSLGKKGTIALGAGYHTIDVRYFESAAGESLKLEWVSNNMERQNIESEYLFHHKKGWRRLLTD